MSLVRAGLGPMFKIRLITKRSVVAQHKYHRAQYVPQREALNQAGRDCENSEVYPVLTCEVKLLGKKTQDNYSSHEDMIADHRDAVRPRRFVGA